MRVKTPLKPDDSDEDAEGLPGLYDSAPAEAALWFLPAEEDDSAVPAARCRPLIDLAAWRAAEADLAPDLAALAFDRGRLAERIAQMGGAAVTRLAEAEAASLSWWTGDRVAADRLALWLSFRTGAAGEDGAGVIRTAWAARRLMAPSGLAPSDLSAIFGAGQAGVLAQEVAAALPPGALGAVARGCAAFHLWQALDERPEPLRGLEAAVLGARIGGAGQAPGFLPLALAGHGALGAGGAVARRLAGWTMGAHQAVLAALMTLDRLRQWQARAAAAVTGLSGRTPPRLIACLMTHAMVTAPLVQAETAASRAAAQRNLDLFQSRGLIREVTGDRRFRVWTARL